jgi:hypothetical protein
MFYEPASAHSLEKPEKGMPKVTETSYVMLKKLDGASS